MPTHQIHIGIAKELNKDFNYNPDLFYIGSILPDLGKEHYISHFKKGHGNYDFDKFINQYYDKNNPVMVGYLVHILSDSFYNKYVREKYYIHDDKLCGIKTSKIEFYGELREVTDIKQAGFYDYEYYLLNNNEIPKMNYVDVSKVANIKECNYDLDYINKYIDEHNEIIKKNNYDIKYNIFAFEELDILYKECILYIKNYLDSIEKKQ